MKLLIVDDNKYVVEGLKRQLNWSAFGIDEIFGCYSVAQAKSIMEKEEIDFLISDIEMPEENGFELLFWMQEKGMDTQKLLLTSYADFHYAKAAIDYKCSQYLLKPIETSKLEEVMIEQVDSRVKYQREKRLLQCGNDWLSHQSIIKEMFWKDVLDELIFCRDNSAIYRIKKEGLTYEPDQQFCVGLLCFEPDIGKQRLTQGLLGFSCENVWNEIAEKNGIEAEAIMYNGPFQYAVILEEKWKMDHIKRTLEQFIQAFVPFYHGRVQCYFAENVCIDEIAVMVRKLEGQALENLNRESGIIYERNSPETAKELFHDPEAEIWEELLQRGKLEELYKSIREYFAHLKQIENLNATFLEVVLMDWNMIAHNVLVSHNMTTYQMLSRVRNQEHALLALKSVSCMEELIEEEVRKIWELVSYVEKTDTMIADIRRYIDKHLDSVTRSEISEEFYLSPNYLSKLFRKETGSSLSVYIQNVRMSRAKQLLLETNYSISEIATETGYPSFAHFSKQFKKFVGKTPNEYRKGI